MGDAEPSWLSTGAEPSRQSNSAGLSAPISGPAPSPQDAPFKGVVKIVLTVINMGMMIFMAATGALGIGEADDIEDTGIIFVGLYMLLFAAVLFIYEVLQISPGCSSADLFFKKNFGFLYGIVGKGFFILMMGILAFGLEKPRSLAVACGVTVAAWGPAQILLFFKWPLYFDIKEKYQP